MIRKFLVCFVLSVFITNCFAGFSSGGRSGFSGGGRSYSSSSYSRGSYSAGRSGFSRSTSTARTYTAPTRSYSGSSRSYSGSSSNTVINNHHYTHGGGLGFGGGGFMNGFLGGYLGGSLANSHHTTVVAGGAPVMAQGQGMLMDGAAPMAPVVYDRSGSFFAGMITLFFLGLIIWGIIAFIRYMTRDDYTYRNRW